MFTDEEYSKWLEERHRAEVALEDRENLLFNSAHGIETKLDLLGATGIEDKLQALVPEAIASLQEAGIKVWVLTGDKQETAINIGYSSQLISPEMEVIILNAYSMVSLMGGHWKLRSFTSIPCTFAWQDECRAELLKIKQKLLNREDVLNDSEDSDLSNNSPPLYSLQARLIRLRKYSVQCTSVLDGRGSQKTLVVDGATLLHALDPNLKKLFLEVAEKFKSVLCCRSTPLQKVWWQLLVNYW